MTTTLADTIRQLDGEGTPGDWRVAEFGDFVTLYRTFDAGNLTLGEDAIAETLSPEDAALITTLRNNAAEIADALEGVQRVRGLHFPMHSLPGASCIGCDYVYPCPTIRALDGEK